MGDDTIRTSIDGTPWAEPRGPHLPWPLDGMRWPGLLFLVFAGIEIVSQGQRLSWSGGEPVTAFGSWVVSGIPPVFSFLFGAALFARHPHAWTTDRLLVIGIVLFALLDPLVTLTPSEGLLAMVSTDADGNMVLSGPGVLWQLLIGATGVLGLGCIAVGLLRGRADPAPTVRWTPILVILAVTALASRVVVEILFLQPPFAGDFVSDTLVYAIPLLGFGLATLSIWALVAAVARGAIDADDAPSRGWMAAAWAGASVLAGTIGSNVLAALSISSGGVSAGWMTFAVMATQGVQSLGYVLLFVALAYGVPAIDDEVVAPAKA